MIDYFKMAKWGLDYVGFCQSIYFDFFNLGNIHFLEGGVGQRKVINFLPAQKGRVSINLTQERGGSL